MSWIKDIGSWNLKDWIGASVFVAVVLVIVLGAVGELVGRDLLGGVPVLGGLLQGIADVAWRGVQDVTP